MMLQSLLIGLLFLSALAYVARLVWRSFAAPAAGAGCAKGCGSCSSAVTAKLAQAEANIRRGAADSVVLRSPFAGGARIQSTDAA